MSYWDYHLLAAFILSLLTLTIFGSGYWALNRRLSQKVSYRVKDVLFTLGIYLLLTLWLTLLGLQHLFDDTYNPLWIWR